LGRRVPAWNGRLRSTLRYRATMKERLVKIQSDHVDECICISVKINNFGREHMSSSACASKYKTKMLSDGLVCLRKPLL
jgi:hypothetical protein